jgi:hypothetical protein
MCQANENEFHAKFCEGQSERNVTYVILFYGGKVLKVRNPESYGTLQHGAVGGVQYSYVTMF